MLFSEVYGSYFNVLAEILELAVENRLTREAMQDIIRKKGFEESAFTITRNLKDQTWPLLKEDMTTPLRHVPTQPLTELQKRWMKTLLSDPRVRLFDPPAEGLEDVQPLYPADALVFFDRYGDGDPYEDPQYIRRFRILLTALREKRWLHVRFEGGNGSFHSFRCIPYYLEYSPKDDKFRLIAGIRRSTAVINLARIHSVSLLEPCPPERYRPRPMRKQTLLLEVTDTHYALERCMHHFSHLEKETERLDENRYLLTLHYEKEDETELLIRVLSFGPRVKVLSPDPFREKLLERLKKQKTFLNFSEKN